MPELPEVETIRRGLLGHFLGRDVERVEVRSARAIRRENAPGTLGAAIAGDRVSEVARRGKFLWFRGGSGGCTVVHLGMSGQLLHHAHAPAPLRHEAVRWIHDGGALIFVDQRTFGYVHAAEMVDTVDGLPGGVGTETPEVPDVVSHIARDVLDPYFDAGACVARMSRTSSAIKRVLLDQRYVSGVGNIYADEALWTARIHPMIPARELDEAALLELLDATAEVMSRAVDAGGTSFDALYVDTAGESGYFARELMAYGRFGTPCPRCDTAMSRITVGGRTSHVCASCQIYAGPPG